jgi:hypothetical protein
MRLAGFSVYGLCDKKCDINVHFTGPPDKECHFAAWLRTWRVSWNDAFARVNSAVYRLMPLSGTVIAIFLVETMTIQEVQDVNYTQNHTGYSRPIFLLANDFHGFCLGEYPEFCDPGQKTCRKTCGL